MSENPLQFCRVDPHAARQPRALDLVAGSRRLIYGPDIRPRIEIQDEHDEIELKQHKGDILGAMRLASRDYEPTTFLTVGADHAMVIWRAQGQIVHVLDGHSDQIHGVWELTGDRVVSWSADQTVRVWSLSRGAELTRIKCQIQSVDHLLIGTSGDFLCLMEKPGARMISISGTELTLLKRQVERIQQVNHLADGRWLTRSGAVLKLWSKEGKLLHQFSRVFSLEDGYFELPRGRLVVVDSTDALAMFDATGLQVAELPTDVALAQSLRAFLRSGRAARAAIDRAPTIAHFEHRRSPISGTHIPKHEIGKLGISEDQLARNHLFWDFFSRPDFKRIRTWRREDIQAAVDAKKQIQDRLQDSLAAEASARKFRSIAIGALGVASFVFMIASSGIATLAALTAIASAFAVGKQHLRTLRMRSAQRALDPLLPETDKLITEVKAHRRRILASLADMHPGSLYSGREVQREMQRIIDGELLETALNDCGLLKNDLISENAQPIVLRDWALIQFEKSHDTEGKFSNHTLESFWWTREHGFLFAVQFIQYILLTREKIDVFTVFYDFIRRRTINKSADAFYYRDVTNISKRDVDRKPTLSGAAGFSGVEATEIAMVLTSGQRIALTLLSEDSASVLRSGGRRGDAAGHLEQRRDLEAELEDVRSSSSFSQEEREEEVRVLTAQLETLDAETPADEGRVDTPVRHADKVIANIRSQILAHKQAAASRTDSVWST